MVQKLHKSQKQNEMLMSKVKRYEDKIKELENEVCVLKVSFIS